MLSFLFSILLLAC